jgi:hypothetical protein
MHRLVSAGFPMACASFFPRSALTAALLAGSLASAGAALRVTSDFPSGSARVLALDEAAQTATITPAGEMTRGMPNWWYLRVDGIDPTRPFTLQVTAREVTTPGDSGVNRRLNPGWTFPSQAAVSVDGKTWTQTEPGRQDGNQCIYQVQTASTTVWLAWGPPFTPGDAAEFCTGMARAHGFAQAFTLAQSREGRAVPGLRISEEDRPSTPRPVIWITGRQHAWECGGSWVGIGLAEWLAGDDEAATWLRRNAEVFLVPLMDVDHVASGDGGKHALPQDHNRDWSDAPHWPEVAAVQQQILARAGEGRLAVFLDLHNPSPGAAEQTFYIHSPPYVSEPAAAAQERFLAHARAEFGGIRLLDGNPSKPEHLPIWERISTSWVVRHGNPQTVSLTVETPWNTPKGTPAGYREVGRKLGLTLARYLREPR